MTMDRRSFHKTALSVLLAPVAFPFASEVAAAPAAVASVSDFADAMALECEKLLRDIRKRLVIDLFGHDGAAYRLDEPVIATPPALERRRSAVAAFLSPESMAA